MKDRRRWMIILFVLLAVLVFTYFVFSDEKQYLWFESYRASSDQPYGTMFIQKMLADYREGQDFIINKEPLKNLLRGIERPSGAGYVLIGQNIFLDDESKAALVSFLNSGGDVFIASLTPPDELLSSVYFPECDTLVSLKSNFTKAVRLNFFHESLHKQPVGYAYAFRFGADVQKYDWSYFSDGLFCDSTRVVTPLGYQDNGGVNFIRIAAGQGNLYLHSNPLVFTNYFLTKAENVSYASAVFSHLGGERIIWDEYSKIRFPGNNNAYDSPLYYILQQPSLKYAWWLLLVTVLLYVIFAARRKQRVIPIREPKTNSSLEFVNLISSLHYKNGNHLDMAHKKMRYFLYFVRSRYAIPIEKFKEEHIRRLSDKSKVPFQEVDVIFNQYYLIQERFRENIEANRLVDLYNAIDNFYKQCK